MLKRTLTAVVALAVLIPILLFAPYWAVAAVFALLAAVAVFEISGCVGLRREWLLTAASMGICAAATVEHGVLPACGTALVLLCLAASVLGHKRLPVDRLMLQCGMTAYVAFGFGALAWFAKGGPWLWVALCIPWVADTLAYFTGFFLGKRKLCPEISPKKTVEGAVGGVAGTGVVALIVFGCVKGWDSPLALIGVLFAAMLLAVVSIFGDLFASVLKRQFGVKDYGFIFPGHGGVMDRFDSTIPVAIVLFLLMNVTPLGGLL